MLGTKGGHIAAHADFGSEWSDPRPTAEGGGVFARVVKTKLGVYKGREGEWARVILCTTSQQAGNNYIVKAKFYPKTTNQQDIVSPDDASDDQSPRTMEITAWKRIYLQVDRMFIDGSDAVAIAGLPDTVVNRVVAGRQLQQGRNEISVADRSKFAVNTTILIFDSRDDGHREGELGVVRETGQGAGSIFVQAYNEDGDLTRAYRASAGAHVGVWRVKDGGNPAVRGDVNSSATFYFSDVVDTLRDIYAPLFVEFVSLPNANGWVPLQEQLLGTGMRDFSQRWFRYKETREDDADFYNGLPEEVATGKPNHLHMICGGRKDGDANTLGQANMRHNYAYIYVRRIAEMWNPPPAVDWTANAEKWKPATALVAAHEVGHQFETFLRLKDELPFLPSVHHHCWEKEGTGDGLGYRPPEDDDKCIMNASTPLAWYTNGHKKRFCVRHTWVGWEEIMRLPPFDDEVLQPKKHSVRDCPDPR